MIYSHPHSLVHYHHRFICSMFWCSGDPVPNPPVLLWSYMMDMTSSRDTCAIPLAEGLSLGAVLSNGGQACFCADDESMLASLLPLSGGFMDQQFSHLSSVNPITASYDDLLTTLGKAQEIGKSESLITRQIQKVRRTAYARVSLCT